MMIAGWQRSLLKAPLTLDLNGGSRDPRRQSAYLRTGLLGLGIHLQGGKGGAGSWVSRNSWRVSWIRAAESVRGSREAF